MKLLKQLPARGRLVVLSHNEKIAVLAKSMNITLYDLENSCIFDTLNIKYGNHAVFSKDDRFLVIKTTESKLIVYDALKQAIVFSKKIGKNDGYNIVFVDEIQIITGEIDNLHGNKNVLLDLITLEMKKFSIEGVGLCHFITEYKEGFIVCHRPIDENWEPVTFLGHTMDKNYLEKVDLLFVDKDLRPIEVLYEINNLIALIINYANGKFYLAIGNEVKVIDINSRNEESFCFDEFEVILILSVSKSGKYTFVTDGLSSGFLLNDNFEKLHEFQNSNEMTGISAIFSDDESKILVNSNGKISIYMI